MKTVDSKTRVPIVNYPIRMGIGQARIFVNRKGRQEFLDWVQSHGIQEFRKGKRGDREYLTSELIAAVKKECA